MSNEKQNTVSKPLRETAQVHQGKTDKQAPQQWNDATKLIIKLSEKVKSDPDKKPSK